jgi:hypothetical protein
LNTGVGNKIVLKNYANQPVITETATSIEIAQGEGCGGGTGGSTDPSEDPPSAATRALAFGIPMLFGNMMGFSPMATAVAAGFTAFAPTAFAQTTAECQSVPIEVEIYVDAMVEEIVNKMYQAGEYNPCPAESKFFLAAGSSERFSLVPNLSLILFLLSPVQPNTGSTPLRSSPDTLDVSPNVVTTPVPQMPLTLAAKVEPSTNPRPLSGTRTPMSALRLETPSKTLSSSFAEVTQWTSTSLSPVPE